MAWQPSIIAAFLAAVISASLAFYAWRHRFAPGASSFVWLMLLVAAWSLMIGLGDSAATHSEQFFWTRVRFICVVFAPVAWLAFAARYVGYREWATRTRIMQLSVMPAVSELLVLTNDTHKLMFSASNLYPPNSPLYGPVWQAGPWFWLHSVYSYGLILVGVALLVRKVTHSSYQYRGQALAFLVGGFLPVAAVSITSYQTLNGSDSNLAPIGFALAGLAFGWGMYRYRMFDLVPIARELLIESMTDGMLVLDESHRLVDINPVAQSMIGAPAARLVGRPVDALPAPWRSLVTGYTAGSSMRREFSIGRAGGRYHYDVRISPLRDGQRSLVGHLIVLRDITDRKTAEESLRQAADVLSRQNAELQARNEELDAFAHTVAHDLKNPVAQIIGFADLLRSESLHLSQEEVSSALAAVLHAGYKLNNIIEELMLLAGLRKQQPQLCQMDMSLVVAEAQGRLRGMIQQSSAEITLPGIWPSALGYEPWVEEIWVNYLSNAIKYGGTPPRLRLGAEVLADGSVRFWVRDNGAGISPEDQQNLFTPFTRVGQSRAQGYGLGLSIVRRIVEKLGGRVGVVSKPGGGSTFSFTLPAAGVPVPEQRH